MMRSAQRIKRAADFRAVRARGRRAADQFLILTAASTEPATSRFGLSVGKRVGVAVTRNRVKRRLREILTQMGVADGWDIVVVARPAAAGARFEDLRASIQSLAVKTGVLVEADRDRAVRRERSR